MRKFIITALIGVFSVSAPLSAQVAPNSDFSLVRDFWYTDQNGNWLEYRSAFFSTPRVDGVTPRIWILPTFDVDIDNIRYSDSQGEQFQPSSSSASRVFSVSIPINYKVGLPNDSEQVAIGAALGGEKIQSYITRWPTDNSGNLPMWPGLTANFQARRAVRQAYDQRSSLFATFDRHRDRYKQYNARSVAVNEMRVVMLIDGEEVAERNYPGSLISFGNSLPRLTLRDPTVYEVNKIRNNDFEVNISFRFRDSQTSFISGRFRTVDTINQFVRESQRVRTRRKSSGIQIMGFGNRRNRLKKSITQNFESNMNVEQIENTTIITFDADDAMMARFEDTFFPRLSHSQLIDNHIAAAASAKAEGKPDLEQVHRDYADAMARNDPSLEVDMEKAAAALANQDWASFLAHGVRFSNSDSQRTDDFRRVVINRADIIKERDWLEYSERSVQRQTTIPLELKERERLQGSLGLCGGVPWIWQQWHNNFTPPTPTQGLLVTCLLPNSALTKAGFMLGSVVLSIDGQQPATFADIDRLLEGLRPGQNVQVVYVSQFSPQGAQYDEKKVEVTAGAPAK